MTGDHEASIGEVGDAVRGAIGNLPFAAMQQAAGLIDQAATDLEQVSKGTQSPELSHAIELLRNVHMKLSEAYRAVDQVRQAAQRYLDHIGATGNPSTPTAAPITATIPVSTRSIPDTQRAQLFERARARLPTEPGPRTVGRWVDERGQIHELESGNRRSDGTPDPWFKAAAEYARQLGLVRGRAVLGLTRHVEIKMAMRMRARYRRNSQRPQSETIAIDRPPCGVKQPGEWTCHSKLATFLPPGARLTVIDRDGNRYTYEGDPDP